MRQICLLLLVCVLLLSGCQAQLRREYNTTTPHEEQFEVDQYSDAMTAENYTGLKNAILNFVETGTDYGVIRIYEYDGNIVSDLANAVYEVSHNDPLGAYAVDYMTYDYAHIVSYYELYIYTTFRISVDAIDNIIYCSSIANVESELEKALTDCKYSLAIRISNYQEFDPSTLVHRLFMAHPELGITEPDFYFSLYPNSGIQRILEINISYSQDALSMQSRKISLEKHTEDLVEYLSVCSSNALRIEQMYDWFLKHVTYMGEDSHLFSSSYHAIVNKYGNAMGISMAVQLLCNRLDIPCFTVEGTHQGVPWYWNIIYYDDLWHHMDICAGIISEQWNFTPLYDPDMTEYEWNHASYPTCSLPKENFNIQDPNQTSSSEDITQIDPNLDQLPSSDLDTSPDGLS